uniref:Protein CLEC16A isogeny n=1 Tax=Rhizophora mucronata TaxID=61149 RepID=A0A2P2KZM6_RHIMU
MQPAQFLLLLMKLKTISTILVMLFLLGFLMLQG